MRTIMVAIVIGTIAPRVAAGADPMVVYLDQATVLRLSKPALRVIVGNPAIADVNVDSPQLLSVFGKAAGETNLIVMGAKDQTILSRSLIVINEPDHVVAVHVPGKDGPTSRVYSCIDGRCLRVRSPDDAAASGGGAAAAPAMAAGDQSGGAKPGPANNPGTPAP
jgi:Flp pilus assembly secretin CpaC